MANEVFAPTGATWGPGIAGVGVGTTLPTELANWVPFPSEYPLIKPKSALVFWNPNYVTSGSKPTVKFMFISTIVLPNRTVTFTGVGVVNNPSVSTTAVIKAGVGMTMIPAGYGAGTHPLIHSFYNSGNSPTLNVQDSDQYGNGSARMYDRLGREKVTMISNYYVDAERPNTGLIATWDEDGNITEMLPS